MSPRAHRFELLLLSLALALGVFLRVQGLGSSLFYGDEHHTLLLHRVPSAADPAADAVDLGEASYGEILTTFDQTGSHVVLPLLQRLALDLVGPGPASYRLAAIVPGVLMLLVAYPLLRRFFGAAAACLATVGLALHPMHVFYSHFGRSYALVMFTSVLLVYAVLRGLQSLHEEDGAAAGLLRRQRWWIAVFFLAWFTPYAHLSTAGLVFAIGLVAILFARVEGGGWRAATAPAASFAAAALACALSFLPLYEQIAEYMDVQEVNARPATIVGIPILLYGGALTALAGVLSIPVAAFRLWKRDRAALVLALTTLVGPLVALVVTKPHGMEYAYARYLLCAVPFLMGFLGLAWLALVERFVKARDTARRVAVASGVGLFAIAFAAGPIGPGKVRGPYRNSYLSMFELPAFDEPYPGIPEVYARIAADPEAERIIEFPPIYTRAALMYRNYALSHGKDVTLGWAAPIPGGMKEGPYARLAELSAADGDYLVLHRDPVPEVRRYFRWLYDEVVPRHRRFGDEGYLERNRSVFASNLPDREMQERIAAALRTKFGPAWYKSDEVLVWKFVD